MTSHWVTCPTLKSSRWQPFRALINFLRTWLDTIEIRGSRQAQWICRLIPSVCPFKRDILIGRWAIHIPSFCQVNPLYDQLIGLRFRAISYLHEVSS